MDIKKIKIKMTVVNAKCENCKAERILYFAPSYSYGERVVSTASGKQCAYVNLLGENLMSELEQYCMSIFLERDIEISHAKLVRIVTCLYGITCDDICGEKVDTISVVKCPRCMGKMDVDDKYGETVKEIDAYMATHVLWSSLNREEKRARVASELTRQGYLP